MNIFGFRSKLEKFKQVGRTHRTSSSLAGRGRRKSSQFHSESLEARVLLAADVVPLIEIAPVTDVVPLIQIDVEDDPLREGAVNVTFRRTDEHDSIPMRLELRNTLQGLGFRFDTFSAFNADLDQQTDGVQAFQHVSKLTIVGSQSDDTIVLDESAFELARAFQVDGGGGNDRLEHRRNEISSPTKLVDFNISTGTIEFTFDGDLSERKTRVARTSGFEDFAFYSIDTDAALVVKTGSGHADLVNWQPGFFDVQLGPSPEQAARTRVSYSRYDQVWLLTAGGADTVTLGDHGYKSGTPEAAGQSLLYHDLHVGTQDENDLIRWNLTGSRSIVDISIDGGAGSQNRLEMRSYRGQGEEYIVDGDSIDYFDALHIEQRQQFGQGQGNASGDVFIQGFPDIVIAAQQFAYDDIQQLYLATGGGDDTIVVDQRGASAFPAEVTVETQDDNDAIEVNLHDLGTHLRLDGGSGRNGLTQLVRSLPGSQAANVWGLAGGGGIRVPITVSGNHIHVDYVDTRIDPATALTEGTPTPRMATTKFNQFSGLSLFSYETSYIRLYPEGDTPLPAFVRVAAQGVNSTVSLTLDEALSTTSYAVESKHPTGVHLAVRSIAPADRWTLHADTLSVQGTSGKSVEIAVPALSGFDLYAGPGDDVIAVDFPFAYNYDSDFRIYGDTGNDRLEVRLQAGVSSLHKLSFFGGEGNRDELTIRDAPGNALKLYVDIADRGLSGLNVVIDAVEYLRVFGGDRGDNLINSTGIPSLLDGGDGDDTLFGGAAADVLYGGAGKDRVYGRDGRDALYADHDAFGLLSIEPGDTLNGHAGDDLLVLRGADEIWDDTGTNTVRDFIVGEAFDGTGDWLADSRSLLAHNIVFAEDGSPFTYYKPFQGSLGSSFSLGGAGVAPISVYDYNPGN